MSHYNMAIDIDLNIRSQFDPILGYNDIRMRHIIGSCFYNQSSRYHVRCMFHYFYKDSVGMYLEHINYTMRYVLILLDIYIFPMKFLHIIWKILRTTTTSLLAVFIVIRITAMTFVVDIVFAVIFTPHVVTT